MRPSPKTACDNTSRWLSVGFLIRDLGTRALLFVLAVTALAWLAGCGGTPSVKLVVFDDSRPDAPVHELRELPDDVLEACDLLPIGCEAHRFEPAGLGTVEVHLLPPGGRRGRLIGRRPCWASTMARAQDPVAIAHELGHVFGLDDVDGGDVPRLMDYDAHGAEPTMEWPDVLTEHEVDTILRSAGAMGACSP